MNANSPDPELFNYGDGEPFAWGVKYPGDAWPIAVFDTKEEAEACIAECIRVAALEVDDELPS